MEKEYNGFAIETNPKTTNNFEDSLSGRFTLGETISGATSGATGTLTKKNIDMSQLIVQNVTGAFIGELVGITNTSELITGSTSADTVSTYRVFKYADAPYYYYNENHGTGAIEKIVLTNGGSNYTSIPTVTFSGNGNRIPTATATISGGKVTAININNRGSGHTTLTITITGGGGSGAEARVVLYPNEKLPVTNAVHVDGGVADSDLAYVTNRDHEFNLNEDRSKIRYVDPNYIGQFIDKYKKAINT
jgi:hypothetical protein